MAAREYVLFRNAEGCGWITGTVWTGPQVCAKTARYTTDHESTVSGCTGAERKNRRTPMADMRAADLPRGSIVALGANTYTKVGDQRIDARPWHSADAYLANWYIDDVIGYGAQVIRHGYGEDQP